ncbi:MAG: hypothetical protein LBP59_03765 [Planctomycetaceae bacterium]|nr:hypothetical protein [Planctomycetaceae bacterium]
MKSVKVCRLIIRQAKVNSNLSKNSLIFSCQIYVTKYQRYSINVIQIVIEFQRLTKIKCEQVKIYSL